MSCVLVVDDEPIVREVVVKYLEKEGFDTPEAEDGVDSRPLRRTGDHADGARRGGRQDRRPRAGCGRLRHEAVLTAGARSAGEGGAAAGDGRRAEGGAAGGRWAGDRPGHT